MPHFPSRVPFFGGAGRGGRSTAVGGATKRRRGEGKGALAEGMGEFGWGRACGAKERGTHPRGPRVGRREPQDLRLRRRPPRNAVSQRPRPPPRVLLCPHPPHPHLTHHVPALRPPRTSAHLRRGAPYWEVMGKASGARRGPGVAASLAPLLLELPSLAPLLCPAIRIPLAEAAAARRSSRFCGLPADAAKTRGAEMTGVIPGGLLCPGSTSFTTFQIPRV